jgi:hypothetical protein
LRSAEVQDAIKVTIRTSEEMKGKSVIRVKAQDQQIQRSDLETKKKYLTASKRSSLALLT